MASNLKKCVRCSQPCWLDGDLCPHCMGRTERLNSTARALRRSRTVNGAATAAPNAGFQGIMPAVDPAQPVAKKRTPIPAPRPVGELPPPKSDTLSSRSEDLRAEYRKNLASRLNAANARAEAGSVEDAERVPIRPRPVRPQPVVPPTTPSPQAQTATGTNAITQVSEQPHQPILRPVAFNCPACGAILSIRDPKAYDGSPAPCPTCHRQILGPQLAPSTAFSVLANGTNDNVPVEPTPAAKNEIYRPNRSKMSFQPASRRLRYEQGRAKASQATSRGTVAKVHVPLGESRIR